MKKPTALAKYGTLVLVLWNMSLHPNNCKSEFRSNPTRTAHCITGVAAHGNRIDRFPIYESYAKAKEWVDRLKDFGGTHDIFLVLDLRIWPKRADVGAQSSVAAGKQRVSRVEQSALSGMLDALKPAGFLAYEEPPVCAAESKCLCQNLAYPGWWEQMAKNAACLRLVEQHESRTRKNYTFTTKIRSDYFGNHQMYQWSYAPELTIQLMHSLANAAVPPSTIFVKGWATGGCYGQVDWWALMPRRLAPLYFSVVPGASCAWANATRHLVHATDRTVRAGCPTVNERTLVEWVYAQGGRVANAFDHERVREACAMRIRCAQGPDSLSDVGSSPRDHFATFCRSRPDKAPGAEARLAESHRAREENVWHVVDP